MPLVETLLRIGPLGRAARLVSDWVDLQLAEVVSALERLAPETHGRLLDVGCGDKPYEHLFTPFVTEYVGVEHAATFSTTSAATRDKVDVYYTDDRLPFEDESFDTVLSVQVLEHTPDPAALLKEMTRVLRADGLLILTAPFSFRLHEEPHDYFRFTPHGLRELCARAGLEVRAIEPHGNLWSLIGHKLNSYLALRVMRISQVAQVMGKLGHERSAGHGARLWTAPFAAPAMVAIAGGARLLDRAFPDETEALGYTLTARKKASAAR